MFETAELGRTIDKKEYDAALPKLRIDLLEAQEELRSAAFSTIVVIGGVEGAGKGETTNVLLEWMDPRHIEVHAFGDESDEEKERPEYWRFIRALPPNGRIGIFFGSWHTRPIMDRVHKRIDDAELDVALQRVAAFEQELAEDGTLIVKYWFHLSKDAQRKRLKALEKDPRTRWRVTRQDWKAFKKYDVFRRVSERALRETSTGFAPWTVVEGVDARYRNLTVGRHLLEQIRIRLASAPPAVPRPPVKANRHSTKKPAERTILQALDMTKEIGEHKYKRELEKYRGKLNVLSRDLKRAGRSAVLVFEGWDAAGKGGVVRRITSALDARDYTVIPIAAPTDEERAHHYLWRFWRHLPRAGRITIFDRSWYGRVLVERVEGFATPAEWGRAYNEIVRFEEQLDEHGMLVTKFWVHITKDEQLRRFTERQHTPYKHFKITDEDFRNRERWDDYEAAANEMVGRTSTDYAPWVLVEGNNKEYARLKALKTVCKRIAERLDR
jgi:AMP-polyphosphate phosphotransferase